MEPDPETLFWRVGYFQGPTEFAPRDGYEFSRRFDDARGRFRSIYCATEATTALREVLCDFRINAEARRRHLERYGPEAAVDIPEHPITASWRRQNVLQRVRLNLGGAELIDLTDVERRTAVETRHAALLAEHQMEHLDMVEVMSSNRVVTQTVAADLFDQGAGAIRFASHIDGGVCVAVLEYRGDLEPVDAPVLLTDPSPPVLLQVASEWGLTLEPAQA